MGDSLGLTLPTYALSAGHLREAAQEAKLQALPNPPGYIVIMAPLVFALRPLIGAPMWCSSTSRVNADRHASSLFAHDRMFENDIGMCGARYATPAGKLGRPLPFWYRSQGCLAILAVLVLILGFWLAFQSIASSRWRELGFLLGLAVVPATTDAVAEYFHPQDLLCLGFTGVGLALAIRGRWALAGVMLGAAFGEKQFVLLAFLPLVVSAPNRRAQLRMTGAAIITAFVVIAPFLFVEPRWTLQSLIGVGNGIAEPSSGHTLVGTFLAQLPTLQVIVARLGPIVFALVASILARRTFTSQTPAVPRSVLGLVLACFASRLVFEPTILPYYLLATSATFLLLGFAASAKPCLSIVWIALSAVWLHFAPNVPALDVAADALLAIFPVFAGLFLALSRHVGDGITRARANAAVAQNASHEQRSAI